jgi:hypothetical protein
MDIILENNLTNDIKDRHTLFRLDVFGSSSDQAQSTTQSYALIDAGKLSLDDLPSLRAIKLLHESMIDEYRAGQLDAALNKISMLVGSLGGELDSFYTVLADRINEYLDAGLPSNWNNGVYYLD